MLFLKLSVNLLLAHLNRATFRVAGGWRMPLSEEEAALSDVEQGQEVKRSYSFRADNTDGHLKVKRLPTLPAAVIQIILCIGQIGDVNHFYDL